MLCIEGRYPASLEQLISDYHIIYNQDLFDVQY